MGGMAGVRDRRPAQRSHHAATPAKAPGIDKRGGGHSEISPVHQKIFDLQRQFGNRAVATMLQRLDPGKGAPPPQAAVEQHHPVLRIGSRDKAVKTLQMKLGRKSFRDSDDKLDGIFGPRTRADVVQFQTTHGLTPDGVVGAKTWNALDTYTPEAVHEEDEVSADAVFAQGLAALNAGNYELGVTLYTTLLGMPGMSSKETTVGALINRGVCYQNLGKFGLAVADYERGLESAHTSTERRALLLAYLQRARRNLAPDAKLEGAVDGKGDGGGIKARPDLAPGSTDPAVELLQTKLWALHLAIKVEGDTDTGVLDAATLTRVAQFKNEAGLPAGPVVDAETWHALDTYVPQDRTKADREAFIAQIEAARIALKADLRGAQGGVDALEPLAFTPELLAEIRLKQGLSQHGRKEFAAAVQSYREALELPRLPRSTWDETERSHILNYILTARRGQLGSLARLVPS